MRACVRACVSECVCVCVCARACVCVRARAHARVHCVNMHMPVHNDTVQVNQGFRQKRGGKSKLGISQPSHTRTTDHRPQPEPEPASAGLASSVLTVPLPFSAVTQARNQTLIQVVMSRLRLHRSVTLGWLDGTTKPPKKVLYFNLPSHYFKTCMAEE